MKINSICDNGRKFFTEVSESVQDVNCEKKEKDLIGNTWNVFEKWDKVTSTDKTKGEIGDCFSV